MPRKTKVETVFENEPFELDRIKCPECDTEQEARIYPERKVNKKLHKCACCGFVIHKKDWASIEPVE